MPKIGMRMIKSSLAVLLCFVIYFIRGEGMPFYSAIAAILCMQPYVSNSLKAAETRTVGTIVGGLFGMVVLVLSRKWIPANWDMLYYFIISLCIIPLIYLTVIFKKTQASYITCVVFLSVTVTHVVDVNPYTFALNRILDTLIGIVVSLGVNVCFFPKKENQGS